MDQNKKYEDYTTFDFLQDEFFVRWARNDDTQLADFWEKWLSEHPEKKSTVEEARRLVSDFNYSENVQINDEDYVKIYEAILKKQPSHPARKHFRIPSVFYKAAAAVIIVAMSVLLTFELRKEADLIAEEVKISKTTKNGEKLTFKLSDGTIVKLNSASELTYYENVSDGSREVSFTGEGFFEVAEDKTRPFIVRTDAFTSEVLGTSFNIKSYPNDTSSTVTLVTGKVKVNTKQQSNSIVLVPGQQALLRNDTDDFEIYEVNLEEELAWRDGILLFAKSNFEEVTSKLERWYGVKIIVKGQHKNLSQFSGKFENESLENILDILAYSSGFQYEINGKTITINF